MTEPVTLAGHTVMQPRNHETHDRADEVHRLRGADCHVRGVCPAVECLRKFKPASP
jgi:hypothetical protein